MEKVNLWVRAGITISADKSAVFENTEKALIDAIKRGDYRFDGEVYMPGDVIEELIEDGRLPESAEDGIEFHL